MESSVYELFRDEIENKYNSNDYLKIFRYVKENQMLCKTYFKLGYDSVHYEYKYDTNLAKELFDNKCIEYHIEFFRACITSIIKM